MSSRSSMIREFAGYHRGAKGKKGLALQRTATTGWQRQARQAYSRQATEEEALIARRVSASREWAGRRD